MKKYSCRRRSSWPCSVGVVGIEHARDGFGARARGGGADHVALVEHGKLYRRGRARRPQPQRIGVTAAPAADQRVMRHRQHGLVGVPVGARGRKIAALIFDHAAELDGVVPVGMIELPRIAARQPVLRKFLLPAVFETLLEQTVLVADAVTVGGNAERRHAVDETGGEAPEAAVAERGVGLTFAQADRDRRRGWRARAAPAPPAADWSACRAAGGR